MAEFNDADLFDDQPTDTDLVRQLRHQLRQKDKTLGELTKKVETFEKTSRTSTLAEILKGKGVDPKAAAFVPADLEATPETVEKWLADYADVLKIERAPEGQAPAGEAGTGEQAPEGAGAGSGVSAQEQAALAAAQRTETGGQAAPLLGADRIQAAMSDIRALPTEDAFKRMKELGLVG